MAVDGTYNIELETPMGNRPGKLTLKTEGGSLSGSIVTEQGEQSFEGGTTSGDDIAFPIQLNTAMGSFNLKFKGTVSGDAISGQIDTGSFGSFPFKGTRA